MDAEQAKTAHSTLRTAPRAMPYIRRGLRPFLTPATAKHRPLESNAYRNRDPRMGRFEARPQNKGRSWARLVRSLQT
ncbi:hypothetical protein D3C81_2251080 [compost metagenome]